MTISILRRSPFFMDVLTNLFRIDFSHMMRVGDPHRYTKALSIGIWKWSIEFSFGKKRSA